MAKANFDRYLDVEVEDISASKPLPLGHFLADIISWKTDERDYKNDKGPQPVVELTFKTTSPCDDVDESELGVNGGVGVLCTKDYSLNPVTDGKVEGGGQAQIRRIAEEFCGLSTKGLKLRDVLEALVGQGVKLYSEPRQSRDDDTVFFTNIKKVLSATED